MSKQIALRRGGHTWAAAWNVTGRSLHDVDKEPGETRRMHSFARREHVSFHTWSEGYNWKIQERFSAAMRSTNEKPGISISSEPDRFKGAIQGWSPVVVWSDIFLCFNGKLILSMRRMYKFIGSTSLWEVGLNQVELVEMGYNGQLCLEGRYNRI